MTEVVTIKKDDKVVLTPGQEIAAKGLIEFLNNDFNPSDCIRILTGEAGTGKSFVMKYILKHCKWAESMIEFCAPTHKAADVLKRSLGGKQVHTIQSLFGFRMDVNVPNFDPLNPKFSPKGKNKLDKKAIVALVVDEASMLNHKLVKYMIKYCKSRNIRMIASGDCQQLPPVNEKVSYAFTLTDKQYQLTQIIRQEEDNPMKELLKKLRYDIDHNTYTFFQFLKNNRRCVNSEKKGYVVCDAEHFQKAVDYYFHDSDYLKNVDRCRIICYTNNAVNMWNNYVRKRVVPNSDKGIITIDDLITSNVTLANEYNQIIMSTSEDYIIKNIGNSFFDEKYGFMSYLVDFQNVLTGTTTRGLQVIDHTHRPTFLAYYKEMMKLKTEAERAPASTRSSKWKRFFEFRRKYLLVARIVNSRTGDVEMERDLDYGFAITSHRSQGSTYNIAMVDVDDIVYDKHRNLYTNKDEMRRRLYVACSRPRDTLVLKWSYL